MMQDNQPQENAPGTATGEIEAQGSAETQPSPSANGGAGADGNLLSQDKVNEIVRERLSKQERSFYEGLEVKDGKELGDLLEKARKYDALSEEKSRLDEEIAFMRNGIDPKRADDVRTWFKGKGKAIDGEGLAEAVKSHPEWIGSVEPQPMGAGGDQGKPRESEEDMAARIFNLGHGFVH